MRDLVSGGKSGFHLNGFVQILHRLVEELGLEPGNSAIIVAGGSLRAQLDHLIEVLDRSLDVIERSCVSGTCQVAESAAEVCRRLSRVKMNRHAIVGQRSVQISQGGPTSSPLKIGLVELLIQLDRLRQTVDRFPGAASPRPSRETRSPVPARPRSRRARAHSTRRRVSRWETARQHRRRS